VEGVEGQVAILSFQYHNSEHVKSTMTSWSYDGDDLLIRVKVDDDLHIRVENCLLEGK
jgi:hypothetical protein